jgi:hypothetical protein
MFLCPYSALKIGIILNKNTNYQINTVINSENEILKPIAQPLSEAYYSFLNAMANHNRQIYVPLDPHT